MLRIPTHMRAHAHIELKIILSNKICQLGAINLLERIIHFHIHVIK